jgi:hypothetical protein
MKNKIRLQKFFEFKKSHLEPINSFKIKDTLHPKVWDGYDIDQYVLDSLLQIGRDFYKSTDLEAEILDIVLCGSLTNYNWSDKYSDFDLHIIIDYKEVNDDLVLVEKVCDLSKKKWNWEHNIKLRGFDVEVAIQDNNDLDVAIKEGRMGGVYSLMNEEWIKKPKRVNFVPDKKLLSEKAKTIMMEVDLIRDMVKDGGLPYEDIKEKIKTVWDKIKKMRESSLEEEGEYGIGNLLFKLLRRNGYIGKIIKLKQKSYDQQFESRHFKYFLFDKISDEEATEVFGFNRDDIDDFVLGDIIDDLGEYFEVSVNFNLNNGYVSKFPELKRGDKIICEIHFYVSEKFKHLSDSYYVEMMSGCRKIKTDLLITDGGESLVDLIKSGINLDFFQNLGFNVEIRESDSFNWGFNRHQEADVVYGGSFISFFIKKIIE